jgi:hypothetical protein
VGERLLVEDVVDQQIEITVWGNDATLDGLLVQVTRVLMTTKQRRRHATDVRLYAGCAP